MDIHKQILHEPCGYDEGMTLLAICNVRFSHQNGNFSFQKCLYLLFISITSNFRSLDVMKWTFNSKI